MGWLFGRKRAVPPTAATPPPPPAPPEPAPESFWEMFTRIWTELHGRPPDAPTPPRPGEPGSAMAAEAARDAQERREHQEALVREMTKRQRLGGLYWPNDR